MKKNRLLFKMLALGVLVLMSMTAKAADFTTGNIVVALGDAGTAASAVSLLEYNTTTANQASPVQTINLNATAGSTMFTTGVFGECQLQNSEDGDMIVAMGYNAAAGSATATYKAANKSMIKIGKSGIPSYTELPQLVTQPTRSIATVDGSAYWMNPFGIYGYFSDQSAVVPATSITTGIMSVTGTAHRHLRIFKNILYAMIGANIFYSDTELPTTAATATNSYFTLTGAASGGFQFFDMDATANWNGTGYDVLYVADAAAGLKKFYWDGTVWTPAGTYVPTAPKGYVGMAGRLEGGAPTLYVCQTNSNVTLANKLTKIIDNAAWNATLSATPTVLATADATHSFRSVAFVPTAVAPTVAITSSEVSPTSVSPIPVTFTFSENVTDFTASDVTLSAGSSLSAFTAVSGKIYTANITPAAGTVTVDVAGSVCSDFIGNNNTASTQFSITSSPTATAPTGVATTAVTAITKTTATSGMTYVHAGYSTIIASGIVWSTSATPDATVLTTKTTDGSDAITALSPGTTYYVRAYATNGIGTSYGSDVMFSTKDFEIAATTADAGKGSVAGGGFYTTGDSVTVTASALAGYRFTNWTDGGNPVSNSRSYTFTASADRALVANYGTEQAVYYVRPTGSTKWANIGATADQLITNTEFNADVDAAGATKTYYLAPGTYTTNGIAITTGKIYGGFTGDETSIDLNARTTSDVDANAITEPWEMTNVAIITSKDGTGAYAGAGTASRMLTVTGGEVNGLTLYDYRCNNNNGVILLGEVIGMPTDNSVGLAGKLAKCIVRKIKVGSANGVIMMSNAASILDQCLLEDNNADTYGGTVFLQKYGGTVSNSVIRNNYVTTSGGAVFLNSPTSGTVAVVKNCAIYNNTSAGNGGAIQGAGVASTVGIEVINCTVVNNKTTNTSSASVVLGTTGLVENSIVLSDFGKEITANNLCNNVVSTIYGEVGTASVAFSPSTGHNNTAGIADNTFSTLYFKTPTTFIGAVGNSTDAGYDAVNGPAKAAAIKAANFRITDAASAAVTTTSSALTTNYTANSLTVPLFGTVPTTDITGFDRPSGVLTLGAYQFRTPIVVSSDINSSTLPLSTETAIVVSSGHELTINQAAEVKSITIAAGAKLTVSGTNTITAPSGITLESDATGTATIVDSYSTPTVTATVKQYLSSARNWYFTPAVTGVAVPASSTFFGYDESGSNDDFSVSGASAYWKPYSTNAPLTAGKGYIIQSGSATTLSFNNTTVSGDVSLALTYNSGKGNGYNLVGNPYPSYLIWSAVATDVINTNVTTGANMPTGSIWYRTVNYNGKNAWTSNNAYSVDDIVYNGTRFYKVTSITNSGLSASSGNGPTGTGTAPINDNEVTWVYEGSVYVFATVSASGQAVPSFVNNLIPPMQAFWVKTGAAGGTLHFKNTMRSHNTTGGLNSLKGPKSSTGEMPLVRLSVTNGAGVDEAVVFASENATNAFDLYDAPKYFNTNSNQAEIYSKIGDEKLVINAMKEITAGTEIALGFVTEKSNNFKLSATELKNIGSDLQVLLKDKQLNREFDLTNGNGYEFSSEVVNSADRFSLIFRTSGTSTGIDNTLNQNAQVFVNANNQITIIAPEKARFSIFNAVGQLIENGILNTKHETQNAKLNAGVYMVNVNNQSTRVIIK